MGTDDRKGGDSQGVDTTFRLGADVGPVGGPLEVVLVSDDAVTTTALPAKTPVIVGRGNDADVRVANASLSRKHAALYAVGREVEIEDLGSSNGTKIGGAKLERGRRRSLGHGEVVELGEVLMMVRPARTQAAPIATMPGAPAFVIGESMKPLYAMLDRVAVGNIGVLLRGETGVGKEVLAHALHDKSPRASKPFVTLNCAALPEMLLESELFGHERGAFTGASQTKQGLLETADGGTLLLDEIGELPLAMQSKILRVLEDRRVLRVGGTRDREIDVRFIAATHRDLEADAAAGRFRSDLLYRLNGITLYVPPLRERVDEIPSLAAAFVARARAQIGFPGTGVGSITPEAMRALERHLWPGNVRELRNAIDRAVLLAGGGPIEVSHLPDPVRGERSPGPTASGGRRAPVSGVSATERPPPPPRSPESETPTGELGRGDLRSAIEEVELARIVAALEECAGNQTRAAKALGISRRALVRKLETYGLPRPRKR